MYWTTIDTPAGPFTLLADDDAVLASGWTDDVDVVRSVATAAGERAPVAHRGASPFVDAVAAYCDGDLDAAANVPVRQASGPFITRAWETLRTVEPGEVISYTELARRAGRPAAVRAAASACARNGTALFVPCHRVRRRDGGAGGFRWGVDVKRWLIDHERRVAADRPAGGRSGTAGAETSVVS